MRVYDLQLQKCDAKVVTPISISGIQVEWTNSDGILLNGTLKSNVNIIKPITVSCVDSYSFL